MASGVGVTLVVCALVAQILTQSVSLEGKEECKPFIKFATPEDIKSQNTRLGRRISQSTVSGFHPQDVKQFYGFSTSSSAGSGKTIAVIAAYDNPNVESDLGVFSTEFGLPSCTTANGCFKKVNSVGGTTFKAAVAPWPSEICLDVQWVHAIAPGAKIVLVLADTAAIDDLMKATAYAKTISDYLSMSWGTYELSAHAKLYDSIMLKSGLSIFASSGDEGALVTYPSASKNVIAVGGTSLKVVSPGRMVYETGWKGSGGGCSLYSTATTAQKSVTSVCGNFRGAPDVALVGDPTTGVSVYDSYGTSGSAWKVAGGTSLSAPLFCAKAAVDGIVVTSDLVYGNSTIQFNDILKGTASNDKYTTTFSCGAGYDLVTGLGSWKQAGGLIVTEYNSASLPKMCWMVLVIIVALVY